MSSILKPVAALSAIAALLLSGGASVAAPTSMGPGARPMFLALPPHDYGRIHRAVGTQLAQWNGSFVDKDSATWNFTMVGADPAVSNEKTTIPVVIVPIRMVYGATNGNMTFDPTTHTVAGGLTVLQSVTASPLFDTTTVWTSGGKSVGTGQYMDAYQRANFWGSVSGHKRYHTVLGQPKVMAMQTINVKPKFGSVQNFFGTQVGTMAIGDFDVVIHDLMAKFGQISPGVIPIFLTYNVYLTNNRDGSGCCIGGYHSATGGPPAGQTYMVSTYVDTEGAFAQDVAALSHEVGEWYDDPFVNNSSPCGILENGDPLENEPAFGTFVQTLGSFDYHLQDLVFMPYFGAPKSTSVGGQFSFKGVSLTVCQNGA